MYSRGVSAKSSIIICFFNGLRLQGRFKSCTMECAPTADVQLFLLNLIAKLQRLSGFWHIKLYKRITNEA